MRYEIRVEAILDEHWSAWFVGMDLHHADGMTIMTGTVVDEAALHGLLAKIRDLYLPLISVRRLHPLADN